MTVPISFFGLMTHSDLPGAFNPNGYGRAELEQALQANGISLTADQHDMLWKMFDLNADQRLTQAEVQKLFPALMTAADLSSSSNYMDVDRLVQVWDAYGRQLTDYRFCGVSLYELFSASGRNFGQSGMDFFSLTQDEFDEALERLDIAQPLCNAAGGYNLSTVSQVLFSKLKGSGNTIDLRSLTAAFSQLQQAAVERTGDLGYGIPGFDLQGSGESQMSLEAVGAWVEQSIYEDWVLPGFHQWQAFLKEQSEELKRTIEKWHR